MKNYILNYLQTYFEELQPFDFYRSIFPEGSLEVKGQQEQGKYNAIAVELLPKEDPKGKTNAMRHIITDDLDLLKDLLQSDNFIIMSPISYIGRSRQSSNARDIYAIAIDLDGITEQHYLHDLFHQIEIEYIPKPTYIVFSGTGLHLYYQLEQPLPCFENIVKQAAALKKALTKKIWNSYITSLHDKPQYESLFQGFRIAGGITKDGNRTRVFETGKKVDIDYLNSFVSEEYQLTEYTYKSNLTLKQAEEKYPDWYERRIVNNEPKGSWECSRAVYDWWYKKVYNEASEGHRYYCIMILAIYAIKSGVSYEELERDAFSIVDHLDQLTTQEDNHFTRDDILSALEMYDPDYKTFPIDTIIALSNIAIKKNKRNGRKQKLHLEIARSNKAILKRAGALERDGRPAKGHIVKEWQQQNPGGKPNECIAATGLGKSTVYKYWEK